VVTENLDADKRAAAGQAEPPALPSEDERGSNGLPGRPMALLIALGLAMLSALVAWLVTGGFRALFG
jgi:hypothetical protein